MNAIVFVLVLTSCVIDDKNEVICEPFIVDEYKNLQLCEQDKVVRIGELLELETINCEMRIYEK